MEHPSNVTNLLNCVLRILINSNSSSYGLVGVGGGTQVLVNFITLSNYTYFDYCSVHRIYMPLLSKDVSSPNQDGRPVATSWIEAPSRPTPNDLNMLVVEIHTWVGVCCILWDPDWTNPRTRTFWTPYFLVWFYFPRYSLLPWLDNEGDNWNGQPI